MSHIFISYSRKDVGFAGKIVQALADNKLDTWIDWKSIPKGEDWEQEIYRGIEEADAFLFLISPDSVASEMCNKEIACAVKNGKRILPIIVRDTERSIVPDEISKRNWIFCRDGQDDFTKAIEETRNTIHTDYEWLKFQTELQVKALKWERKKDLSRLLRGKELREAEQQLAEVNSYEDPQPTKIQREFVLASRKNEERLRRQTTIGLIVGLAVMAGLAFIAWDQRNVAIEETNAKATALVNEENARATAQAEKERAEQQAQISLSRQLAAQAISYLESDYDLALLLAVQGSRTNANSEVQAGLVYVLQSKPQLLTYLRGQTGPILYVGFSSDGKFLASADSNKNINYWDANTGQPLDEPPRSQIDEITNVMWDVQAHTFLHNLHTEENGIVDSLALSPDGALLAESTSEGEIVIWDVRTGTQFGRIFDDQRYSHYALAFSPDGRMLASGGSNGTVRLWDVKTQLPIGEPLRRHSAWVSDWVTDVAFSPDGSQLFSSSCAQEPARGICSLGEILVWDVKTQQLVARLTGHAARINSIAVHPDGKKLASAASDSTVILWDLTHQPFLRKVFEGHSLTVNDLSFSPDGQTLASASSDGTLGVWDVSGSKSDRMLTVLEDGNVKSVAFSPDGLLLVSGDTDGNVRLWDGTSFTPSDELREKNGSSVELVEFSPDGTLLASGHYEGQVLLWNVQTRKLAGELLSESGGNLDIVKSLAFSPDGKLLVSASIGEGYKADLDARGHVLIWDVPKQKQIGEIRDPQNGSVYSLAFSPDGKYFVLGFLDGRLQLVDTKTFQVFHEWQAHVVTTSAVAFNRDGTLLASGGLDKTVSIWDTRSWKLVGSLIGHTGELHSVIFDPTGNSVASAGSDQTVRLWDVGLARWQELACQIAGRNFTQAEWMEYIPNETYRITCPQWLAGQ